jgi:tungstate transport system ATP-binding protein
MPDGAGSLAERVALATDLGSLLPGEARGLVLEVAGKRLIDGVSLRLAAGRITVVMGPNGAGKSLLLRLLHGTIAPSAGAVTWGGFPPDDSVRKRQAMVFQRPVLLRRSVAANIDFVLRLRGRFARSRCRELLGHAGLADQAAQSARLLSGGEQQRLALARALVLEPEVLFLDEPTANLDPASVATIESIVRKAHRDGTKIIFVTHDVSQARRLADEVVFLHRGRVAEQTGAAQFFDDPVSQEGRDYLAGRIVL